MTHDSVDPYILIGNESFEKERIEIDFLCDSHFLYKIYQ